MLFVFKSIERSLFQTPFVEIYCRHYNVRTEIMIKTILQQIITQCAGTQDTIKKLASCDPCGRKSGLKMVAFLLRLSICWVYIQLHKTACHLHLNHLSANGKRRYIILSSLQQCIAGCTVANL